MNAIQNGLNSPKTKYGADSGALLKKKANLNSPGPRGHTAKTMSRIDSRCMRNPTCRIDTTHETPDVDLASFFCPCVVAGSRLNEITVYLYCPPLLCGSNTDRYVTAWRAPLLVCFIISWYWLVVEYQVLFLQCGRPNTLVRCCQSGSVRGGRPAINEVF